jgi:hypothetical protein
VLVGRHRPIEILRKLCDRVELGVVRILSAARRVEPRRLPTSDPGSSRASPSTLHGNFGIAVALSTFLVFFVLLCRAIRRSFSTIVHRATTPWRADVYGIKAFFRRQSARLTSPSHHPCMCGCQEWLSCGCPWCRLTSAIPRPSATRVLLFME